MTRAETTRWLWQHTPHAHKWRVEEAKRFCSLCGREEWIFENPYPHIGQPKYEWKEMNFDRLKF